MEEEEEEVEVEEEEEEELEEEELEEEEMEDEEDAVKTGPKWWCSFLHSQPDACGLTQMLSSPPHTSRRRWCCQPVSRQSSASSLIMTYRDSSALQPLFHHFLGKVCVCIQCPCADDKCCLMTAAAVLFCWVVVVFFCACACIFFSKYSF